MANADIFTSYITFKQAEENISASANVNFEPLICTLRQE
jgi:hypothetical protein